MILTAKQVEALDVGTTMGRLADLKNLLFIMDSWMTARGKADELNREADCSKYDLEALWHELPMYYTLLWSIIEAIDKSQAELLDTAKTLDALNILKGYRTPYSTRARPATTPDRLFCYQTGGKQAQNRPAGHPVQGTR